MNEYFDGIRWECTAHYPLIKDRVFKECATETERDDFVETHLKKGANVNVDQIKWRKVNVAWAFHKTPIRATN